MNVNQQHKKILLSGDEDCTVVFCPTCHVVEVILRAATIRIHPDSLQAMSAILLSASKQLIHIQESAQVTSTPKLITGKSVH